MHQCGVIGVYAIERRKSIPDRSGNVSWSAKIKSPLEVLSRIRVQFRPFRERSRLRLRFLRSTSCPLPTSTAPSQFFNSCSHHASLESAYAKEILPTSSDFYRLSWRPRGRMNAYVSCVMLTSLREFRGVHSHVRDLMPISSSCDYRDEMRMPANSGRNRAPL
jgi:hypothetical protein